ncbi:hypothetical protein PLICRDRAFT_312575 [Plicaturopsis crispa FD-325 SS-3]|nr:hypothetical protein PLICRDRAFT_312575 [Plicaturopsis crispa FD-325 SS-3]
MHKRREGLWSRGGVHVPGTYRGPLPLLLSCRALTDALSVRKAAWAGEAGLRGGGARGDERVTSAFRTTGETARLYPAHSLVADMLPIHAIPQQLSSHPHPRPGPVSPPRRHDLEPHCHTPPLLRAPTAHPTLAAAPNLARPRPRRRATIPRSRRLTALRSRRRVACPRQHVPHYRPRRRVALNLAGTRLAPSSLAGTSPSSLARAYPVLAGACLALVRRRAVRSRPRRPMARYRGPVLHDRRGTGRW